MEEQRVALVTGASSGMGRETARMLAERGIFVVLLCRSPQRGCAALEYVLEKSNPSGAALMLCDLGDMADIRRFCAEFSAAYGRLDILVNNAGVLNVRRQETKDGLESHFGVCHIGHFLLTNLLLPRMRPGARIVVVGSVAHKAGKLDFDDLGMERGYTVAKAYSRAKLCNMLFTGELARRLSGAGITVNCAHPGAVITNIGAGKRSGRTDVTRVRALAGRALSPFVKTPEQGAATAVYLAVSDACAGVTGGYFSDCKQCRPSPKAEDAALAQALWRVSAQITGLNSSPAPPPPLQNSAAR